MSGGDYQDVSMLDLFRIETESQVQLLTAGLLMLERTPADAVQLEACMRAAHSLKGAARIVERDAAVTVAHAMEDCFVAAQEGRLPLTRVHIDWLLQGIDLLTRIAQADASAAAELAAEGGEAARYVARMPATGTATSDAGSAVLQPASGNERDEGVASPGKPVAPSSAVLQPASGNERDEGVASPGKPVAPSSAVLQPASGNERAEGSRPAVASGEGRGASPSGAAAAAAQPETADRVLRVTADNLNRLLGLAGESLVEARWLKPFSASLLRLRRLHDELGRDLDRVRDALDGTPGTEEARIAHADARRRLQDCATQLAQRLGELDMYDRRSASLSHRLYREALAVRMRPFADGTPGLRRMVRDLARELGKEARLEIRGEDTEVDRDILERLEAPLGHLLRNAVDHGIEPVAERLAAGKAAEGVIVLEARHSAGRLQISVTDDGRGITLAHLRERIVARGLTTPQTAAELSEAELLEFLFLPGMSLRDTVTEVSGRGVGLDVVQTVVKQLRGTTRVQAQPGRGMTFQLQLPLTLSVVRALLVEIAGEPYAFPLAYVARTLKVPPASVSTLEGRQHFDLAGRRTSLVTAHQVLELPPPKLGAGDLPVVVIGSGAHAYGLIVDRLLGERELVVQPLDRRLGKLRDVAAGALMEDGSPVLLFDLDDMIRSVEKLLTAGALPPVAAAAAGAPGRRKRRVLIVDDSLTVRELERKLLAARGYAVEVAVDGMDGWNALRSRSFDLVVTDIDMPRMDGIELVTLIKRDPKLKVLPVMIVSYKDREVDRQRGLDAGADYYLAKGSFHDETLLQAVVDLIGEAES